MTDDERAARRWLNNYRNHINGIDGEKHIDLVLRLLDRPVMPRGSEVPEAVLRSMVEADANCEDIYVGMRAAIDALHAHLTAQPPVKKIELFAVVSPTGDVISVYDKDDGIEPRVRNGGRLVRLVEADDADN